MNEFTILNNETHISRYVSLKNTYCRKHRRMLNRLKSYRIQ